MIPPVPIEVLMMGKYKQPFLLLVVLCLQLDIFCQGHRDGPETCSKYFVRDGDRSNKAKCSLEELFTSSLISSDWMQFGSLNLTTVHMETECHTVASLKPVKALEGSLTFRSTDELFQKRRAIPSLCIRLRGMPGTLFQVRAKKIEGWMKSEDDVKVGIHREQFYEIRALAKGMTIQSDSNDTVLTIHGLWDRFKRSSSEMTVKLVFQTVPECMKDQLQVTCPKTGFAWSEVDIVFILDASASVWTQDFTRMLNFVMDILEMADVDSGNVRVAAITFSEDSQVKFHLNSYQTKKDVFEAVEQIPHEYGVRTNTGAALHTVRTEVFTAANGDRPGIPNVAILLTDGRSQEHQYTVKEAEKARAHGIRLYAIGIGADIFLPELNGIASQPADEHRFTVQNFTVLGALRDHFFSSLYPGHIQTYNWNGATEYQPSMDVCVRIEAPANHAIMISFVMLDLQTCLNCQCDVLEIYLSPVCSGTPESVICNSAEAVPAVYSTDVVSVRFKSDPLVQGTGFRLLFSFHPSAAPPQRWRNGRWVCSGDEGQVLVLHFICSFDTFCLNAEDKAAVCPPADFCGDSSFWIDGRCYRYVRPDRRVTWTEASDSCQDSGGHLVSLNTEQEWREVAEFWMNTVGTEYLMVGLRHSSHYQMPDLYSSMWRWNDGTIAYYLNNSRPSGDILSTDSCSVFQARLQHLTFVSCNLPLRANYLCEMESQTGQAVQSREQWNVTLPSPSTKVSNMSQIIECPDEEATLTFLQCDRSSHCYGRDVNECLRQHQEVAETMFTCRNKHQLVHYTLVCDHRRDCVDGSDEDFCVFPPCRAPDFSCWESSQCIPQNIRCDGIHHCIDRSDEDQCWDSVDISQSNTVLPPAIIRFGGAGNVTVTALSISHNDPVCPETHFQCPRDGYCLPVFVRCNNVSDCPGGEDEAECGSYKCPGFYRCHGANICVHADHLCDGEFQCPRHDDELMCNMTCPSGCTCTGFAFDCSEKLLADRYPQLRYLRADMTGMTLQDVAENSQLIYLSLRHCHIKEIDRVKLPNLHTLDLSHNSLTSFTNIELGEMTNLRSLSLAHNGLLSLNAIDDENEPFPGLIFLDMSGSNTREISNISFVLFPNTEHLNLSGSQLHTVLEPGFSPLQKLNVLDLSGCPVTEFYGDMFKNLSTLEKMYTSNFHMCCPSILPESVDPENCHGPSDEVSSCAALLREDIFRVFLVMYTLFALGGNFVSFVYRVFGKGVTTKLGFDTFVTHLCVSDFLMGIYLAIVGIADRIYYGNYEWNATQWKQSVACQMAGFLSFLSSEVSAFLICFITLERFLVIRFPLKNLRFTPKQAQMLCTMAWVVGALLAAIPLLPFSPPWDFYSQTGICVPLPITRKVFPGSEYSFHVMIVFNFILFLLIAGGQILIFMSIRSQRKTSCSSSKTAKDMVVARRLLAVVLTDFLCWFPIGLLGLLARSGTPISGDVNVAMAIFVLPFNSALNPFLYTLHTLFEGRCVARMQLPAEEKGSTTSNTCPTCSSRNQGLSGNTTMAEPRQGSASPCPSRSGTAAGGDDSKHEQLLNLIETILQEKLMTIDDLLFLVSQPVRERKSSTAAEICQT